MHLNYKTEERRGSVAPLMAFLMIVIVAMVAFAVDIGWITLAKNQLQNAADAAALAGADPLSDGYVNFNLAKTNWQKQIALKTYLTSARDKAKKFAKHNLAGGAQDLALLDEDIEFGYRDTGSSYTPTGTFVELVTNDSISKSLPAKFPNTIRVIVRRDKQANQPLNLFFGPVIGTSQVELDATASATIYGGKFESIVNPPPKNVAILPVTYDVNAWKHFLATGEDPDGKTATGPNGFPHLQVYPYVKDTGNFGQLSLNDSHAGTSQINDWIHNGLSASDLSALLSNNLVPLSKHDPNAWDWSGNTGFKADTVRSINTYVDQVFALPLFKPHKVGPGVKDYEPGVGNGSQYDYNIVEFVGVRITSHYKDHRIITVQPAPYVDPFITFDNEEPAGSSNTTITTFTTPKLSR